ncbi:MAG TPA: hypothetical protein VJT08_13500 [Terriglobales bacterium]|nr:hypothetical protein [Terriglobales bacterium]
MRNLVWLMVVVLAAVVIRAEVSLGQKVEDAIRAAEPDWKCIHGLLEASPTVPSEKRLLISRWEHRSTNGQLENVVLWMFHVESRTDAEIFLAPEREGKLASGWKVHPYSMGDEAYLSKYSNGQWYEITFRKGMVVVEVKSQSSELVERFAKYAANQIPARQ